MKQCLALAAKGSGRVSPNPMVGALLVRKNRIVARGWHKYFGGPHAEAECLRQYKGPTDDATLYVNLEPCNHFGKTPPCVNLILQRGIRKVVVAMKDPNPLVIGKGIARLRRNGVQVHVGIAREEAEYLNRFFVKNVCTKAPYVCVKIAQTGDGFIAKNRRSLHYITGLVSRTLVHKWRSEYDAVLVGAGTITIDNPRLDTRLVKGRDPAVVVVDGRLSITGSERIFRTVGRRRVIVCTTAESASLRKEKCLLLTQRGVEILIAPSSSGKLNLRSMLRKLSAMGISSILVEGGSSVFSQFVEEELFDEMAIMTAPRKFISGVPALSVSACEKLNDIMKRGAVSRRKIGRDNLIHLHVNHQTRNVYRAHTRNW